MLLQTRCLNEYVYTQHRSDKPLGNVILRDIVITENRSFMPMMMYLYAGEAQLAHFRYSSPRGIAYNRRFSQKEQCSDVETTALFHV